MSSESRLPSAAKSTGSGQGDAADEGLFPLMVTGGSGRMARIVIEELLRRNVPPHQLIVTTRTPAQLADFAGLGVDVRAADFADRSTLTRAFRGARRCLLVSIRKPGPADMADLLVPGTNIVKDEYSEKAEMQAAVDAAVEAGVEHVYYTSGITPEPGCPMAWADEHHAVEAMVQRSGLTWTILRHARQPDIFLSAMWITGIETGEYFDANDGGTNAWITREDTAAADAGALLAPTSEIAKRIFNIAGPQALTSEDIMATIADILGMDIKVTRVPPGELGRNLVAAGAIPMMAPLFTSWAEATRGGYFATTSRDAARFAARPLETMAEYLQRTLPLLPDIVAGMKRRMASYGVSPDAMAYGTATLPLRPRGDA